MEKSHGRIPKVIAAFNAYIRATLTYLFADSLYENTEDDGGVPVPAPAAPPVIKNWKRLGLLTNEANQWKTLRDEWAQEDTGLYARYSDPNTKTKPLNKKVENFMEEFTTFAQPLLNRIAADPDLHEEDEAVFNIKGKTTKDTEPSPVHGSHIATGYPLVGLKNLGGAIIDVITRRTNDETRASMHQGFNIELRWWALEKTEAAPGNPELSGYNIELSSKAHFQVDAGMGNKVKIFYCYVRWRHKTNKAFISPWTDLLQITVA